MLLDWNFKLEPNSITAGIYNAWEREIRNDMKTLMVPETAQNYISLQNEKNH